MKTLFVICIVLGFLWVVLEQGAKASSPAPSMYRTSGDGWILVVAGIVGFVCVSFLP